MTNNNNHEWAINSQETPNDRQIRSSEITPQVDAGDLHIATQAADWQLKQVIEWLYNNLGHSNYLEPLWPYKIDVDGVLCDLKEAMRPQQQEEN